MCDQPCFQLLSASRGNMISLLPGAKSPYLPQVYSTSNPNLRLLHFPSQRFLSLYQFITLSNTKVSCLRVNFLSYLDYWTFQTKTRLSYRKKESGKYLSLKLQKRRPSRLVHSSGIFRSHILHLNSWL